MPLMGRELFQSNKTFRFWMEQFDKISIDTTGSSTLSVMFDNKKKSLERQMATLTSHPGIFMFSYSLARVAMENGILPDYTIGTSLGEIASACIAEIIEPHVGMELALQQALTIDKNCSKGKMLAILGSRQIIPQLVSLFNVSLVSVYSDDHFVIALNIERHDSIKDFLKANEIDFIELPVSHAFHSHSLDPGFDAFNQHTNKIKISKPKLRFISSLVGKEIFDVKNSQYFWESIRKPIMLREAICQLPTERAINYIDFGSVGPIVNVLKKNGYLREGDLAIKYALPTTSGTDLKKLITSPSNHKTPMNIASKDDNTALIFPGQGSQRKGMGQNLFTEYPSLVDCANNILNYSIVDLCVHDPQNKLSQTQYTQSALYVVNCLSFKKSKEEGLIDPHYFAGHSLGEYSALFASGAFDFETGLKLVKKRGELMSQMNDGGMAAVIGLTEEQVRRILKNENLHTIDIANLNSETQIVISGPKVDVTKSRLHFEKAGCTLFHPLNVSGAFHSRMMESARREFELFLRTFSFSDPMFPVISNVTARPYGHNKINELLSQQITSSVKWSETIRYLMGQGVETFIEVGPGDVLTKLVNKIKVESKPLIIDQPKLDNRHTEPIDIEKEGKRTPNNRDTTLRILNGKNIGSLEFKEDYKVDYAYVSGAMVHGIASKELVVKMGRAGMMGFFGSGGLKLTEIEQAILYIKKELSYGEAYGFNLLNGYKEDEITQLYMKHQIRTIEAAAYIQVTKALVRYRVAGIIRNKDGKVNIPNRIIAKVSRPEVASSFLSPPPREILDSLILDGLIGRDEASLARSIPMADDICVEADSAGHTDQGVASALLPAIIRLRDEAMLTHKFEKQIRVGAAGGIGTPEAAAAALILGADFILTGSINQCTVESGANPAVKDMLQTMNVQDTDYAPAGDMFELGAKIQVLKKGLFFPARANKLYDLYRHHDSIDDLDPKMKSQLENKYFKKSLEEVYEDVKKYYLPADIERAEKNPKQKMAYIFKWYFAYSSSLALTGTMENKVDFQIHCGPALGSFNQWVKGSELENWRHRHVDEIGKKIMEGAADLLNSWFLKFVN